MVLVLAPPARPHWPLVALVVALLGSAPSNCPFQVSLALAALRRTVLVAGLVRHTAPLFTRPWWLILLWRRVLLLLVPLPPVLQPVMVCTSRSTTC
mmetsp:Transcript_4574/g.8128  ORF Transcript_4574/g.8128 Transcript_4574/m.8128 type:complete len:96 (+) Transcript_4574:1057-1344(+)